MNEPAPKRHGVQVIARACAILRALENQSDGLSLGQIAAKVELPRSTVQRIVNALMEENMLISASLNARVKLGPAILRLASNSNLDFPTVVRPYLEDLSEMTGETVDLSMLRGNEMVFVDQIAANHRLSAVSAVGESFPLDSSANGKAAMSLMSDEDLEKLAKSGFSKDPNRSQAILLELYPQLEKARQSFVAFDEEEHSEGICAVGTAFRAPSGNIFAVSVPVPTIRFRRDKDKIIKALLQFRSNLMNTLDN
ncbi:MAG: IclR family transcriptional regulator [Pseudomonadota bacterium]